MMLLGKLRLAACHSPRAVLQSPAIAAQFPIATRPAFARTLKMQSRPKPGGQSSSTATPASQPKPAAPASPTPPRADWLFNRIGVGASVPLVVTTAMMWTGDAATASWATDIQIQYSACLLSSVGAVHLGLECAALGGSLPVPRAVAALAPVALAFVTLQMPQSFAVFLHFVAYPSTIVADRYFANKFLVPPWFVNSRRWLAGFAIIPLVMSFLYQLKRTRDELLGAKEDTENEGVGVPVRASSAKK